MKSIGFVTNREGIAIRLRSWPLPSFLFLLVVHPVEMFQDLLPVATIVLAL